VRGEVRSEYCERPVSSCSVFDDTCCCDDRLALLQNHASLKMSRELPLMIKWFGGFALGSNVDSRATLGQRRENSSVWRCLS
jgi:hypothetical protein